MKLFRSDSAACRIARDVYRNGPMTQAAIIEMQVSRGGIRKNAAHNASQMKVTGVLIPHGGIAPHETYDICIEAKQYFDQREPKPKVEQLVKPERREVPAFRELQGYAANILRRIRPDAEISDHGFYSSGVSAGAIIRGVRVL